MTSLWAIQEKSGQRAVEQPWYALEVRPRWEQAVRSQLLARGFEVFLPLYPTTRQWSDRRKTLFHPLFPGYLFCRFGPGDRVRVLSAPGVRDVVGRGREAIAVSEPEILSVQAMVRSGLAVRPWSYFHVGQRVLIERGPLSGVEGTVVRVDDGRWRLVVSVSLLQRAVAAEVDPVWLRTL